MLLTKTTAAQNEVAPNYHKVRGLYFLGVAFAAAIHNIAYNTAPPITDILCQSNFGKEHVIEAALNKMVCPWPIQNFRFRL